MNFKKLTSVETWDNPFTFIVGITFVLIPTWALLNAGAAKLGWPGPSALIRNGA